MRSNSKASGSVLKASMGWTLLAMIVLLPATSHVSIPQTSSARPRIGLAMGGDGAMGFAQVGVLMWLEEHHVPVDHLAGTSMGGFVGGVYAAGFSPAEIRQFLQGIDFSHTFFLGEAPYQTKGEWTTRSDFTEAENSGFLRGLKISNLLAFLPTKSRAVMIFPFLPRIVNSYSDLQNFDALPTPFRCTAVDLAGGDVVVMDRGSLPVALGATMALPGLIDPVKLGDKVLAGGGPLPVEVTRRGADVVIASYVYSHTESRTDLSLFQQMQRSLELAKADADRREISQADVVIPIDTSKYMSVDLAKIVSLIELGYYSAEKRAPVLMKFSVSDDQWQRHLENRYARRVR